MTSMDWQQLKHSFPDTIPVPRLNALPQDILACIASWLVGFRSAGDIISFARVCRATRQATHKRMLWTECCSFDFFNNFSHHVTSFLGDERPWLHSRTFQAVRSNVSLCWIPAMRNFMVNTHTVKLSQLVKYMLRLRCDEVADTTACTATIEANLKTLRPGLAVQDLVDGQGLSFGLPDQVLASMIVTQARDGSDDPSISIYIPVHEFAQCNVNSIDIQGLNGQNHESLTHALRSLRVQGFQRVFVDGTSAGLLACVRTLASLCTTITLDEFNMSQTSWFQLAEAIREHPSERSMPSSSVGDVAMSPSMAASALSPSHPPAHHGDHNTCHRSRLRVRDVDISFSSSHRDCPKLDVVDLLSQICPNTLESLRMDAIRACDYVCVEVDPLFLYRTSAALSLIFVHLVPSSSSSSQTSSTASASLAQLGTAAESSSSSLLSPTYPAVVSSSGSQVGIELATSSQWHPIPTMASLPRLSVFPITAFSSLRLVTSIQLSSCPLSQAEYRVIAGLEHLRELRISGGCSQFTPDSLVALQGARIDTFFLEIFRGPVPFTKQMDLSGLEGLTGLTDLTLLAQSRVLLGWRAPASIPLRKLRLAIFASSSEPMRVREPQYIHFPANWQLSSLVAEISETLRIEDLVLPSLAHIQSPVQTMHVSSGCTWAGAQSQQPPRMRTASDNVNAQRAWEVTRVETLHLSQPEMDPSSITNSNEAYYFSQISGLAHNPYLEHLHIHIPHIRKNRAWDPCLRELMNWLEVPDTFSALASIQVLCDVAPSPTMQSKLQALLRSSGGITVTITRRRDY